MKVIFLDMDGVMNVAEDWIEYTLFKHPHNTGFEVINRGKLAILWHLLDATGAKIVLSSTWRNHYTLDEIHAMFDERIGPDSENRFPRDVFIDKTPRHFGGYAARSQEVGQWLRENEALGVTHYVILDDVDAGFTEHGYRDQFVKTNPMTGISTKDAYDACEVLDGETSKMPRVFM